MRRQRPILEQVNRMVYGWPEDGKVYLNRDAESMTLENKGERSVQPYERGTSAQLRSEPTEAQKAVGKYKKGHRRVDGYNISIDRMPNLNN